MTVSSSWTPETSELLARLLSELRELQRTRVYDGDEYGRRADAVAAALAEIEWLTKWRAIHLLSGRK